VKIVSSLLLLIGALAVLTLGAFGVSASPAMAATGGSSPSTGPSPASKATFCPSACGISRMSAKTMAALNGKRRRGCSVASAAFSGSRQKATKSGAVARSARYSGR
jgi:hypothetical protein